MGRYLARRLSKVVFAQADCEVEQRDIPLCSRCGALLAATPMGLQRGDGEALYDV
jgi:hypothetical protein